MMDEDQLEERHNTELEQKHTEFRKHKFKIQDDIYSLAYAALINPECLNYDDLPEKDRDKYLP